MYLMTDPVKFLIIETFIKFWIKDAITCREMRIHKSSIIYGKNSVPILQDVTTFKVTDCFVKNPEFTWRPTSERLENLVLLNNDYFGVL